jgi:hypothetical protein
MTTREIAMRYDVDKQPDPQAWLELDESERIDLAIDDGLGSIVSIDGRSLLVRLAPNTHRECRRGRTFSLVPSRRKPGDLPQLQQYSEAEVSPSPNHNSHRRHLVEF